MFWNKKMFQKDKDIAWLILIKCLVTLKVPPANEGASPTPLLVGWGRGGKVIIKFVLILHRMPLDALAHPTPVQGLGDGKFCWCNYAAYLSFEPVSY